jgi:hypothetical protein
MQFARILPLILGACALTGSAAAADPAATPSLQALLLYRGEWRVTADHPWSGAPSGSVDRLRSACTLFHAYLACEQSVNGKPLALIVFTPGARPGEFYTRTIAPSGLAGGRGTMTIEGRSWTFLDKPAAGLTGSWSRVENVIVSRKEIKFAEYESEDEGKTWKRTNAGIERRVE